MKKMLLTAVAVFTLSFVQAQDGGFAKGDIFVSGSVGYNSQSTGDAKTNSFEITPRVGFFVSENLVVGARIGYNTQKQEVPFADEIKLNTFTGGAFGRYYFTPSNKFSIFGELGVNYLSIKADVGAVDTTTDGFGIGGGPGVSYFISDNFALEAFWGALSYASTKPDVDGADSTDSFAIGVNLDDINLGLVYKF
ncbi:outer membrane beta-barrel protein [Aquimarina sp. 2201CG14-23]|uniref:outer membrane beta-barrel protein n=1 Tax=Aquimarina mycalae TaxID=3040073 RepID=UPI002477DCDC|nr:outer membrane beta-barrel protein [Aquimarina sp. 2201CG14-23]MDH7445597.1 outer membrane beta-barrel protein [Aquimarina sp. 2201CG14-23]